MSDWLRPLRCILDRSPRPVRFFFCDDNIGRENACLFDMLDVFEAHQMPIDLGLNPDLLNDSLNTELEVRVNASRGKLALHQQGFRRTDRVLASRPIAESISPPPWNLHTRAMAPTRRASNSSVIFDSDVTLPAVAARRPSQLPLSVDWCSHLPGENSATRDHLGRLIAVAASRNRPVGIILDHDRIRGNELRVIEELLVLLANHRKAQCVSIRQLAGLSGAQDEGPDAAISSQLETSPAPFPAGVSEAPATSPMRWLRDRLDRARVSHRWLWLLACIALAGVTGWHRLGASKPGSQYLTAPVVRGDIENAVLAAGTLQPFEYVDVGAQTSGQLKSLKVQLGDKVAKGQLLAEIDPIIAASKMAEAEATVANLKAQWAGKKEQLGLARRQKSRSDELQRQGAQAASDAEIAESTYELARHGLAELDAQLKQASAALETARANLDYTRITAPMAGEVVAISAREGQTLNASQQAPTILRIAELDTMTVWALVPEADVSHLKLGQAVYFTVLGQSERRWHGTLKQILPSPEIIANVVFYNALFDVPNPQKELKVQMTAQVFFVLEQAKNALYVPLSALAAAKSGKAGRYKVRRLDKDGSIERRSVQVGITNAVSAQIVSGLDEGDAVIVGETDPKKDNGKSASLRNFPIRNFNPR